MASIERARNPLAVGEGKRGAGGHIAYLLRQAHAAVRFALDAAFAEAGLTTPQFLVLNLLDAYPGVSGAELARIALLTPQTVNLIVRKLERDGLLGRVEHETHRRVLRLRLTVEGKARLRVCKRRADEVERQLVGLLSPGAKAPVRAWLVDVAETLLGDQAQDG